MIYPLVSAEYWAEKYGLPIEMFKCGNCGLKSLANIPFATKGYRGLKTTDHGCGINFTSSIAMPIGKSLKKIREQI